MTLAATSWPGWSASRQHILLVEFVRCNHTVRLWFGAGEGLPVNRKTGKLSDGRDCESIGFSWTGATVYREKLFRLANVQKGLSTRHIQFKIKLEFNTFITAWSFKVHFLSRKSFKLKLLDLIVVGIGIVVMAIVFIRRFGVASQAVFGTKFWSLNWPSYAPTASGLTNFQEYPTRALISSVWFLL